MQNAIITVALWFPCPFFLCLGSLSMRNTFPKPVTAVECSRALQPNAALRGEMLLSIQASANEKTTLTTVLQKPKKGKSPPCTF